MVSPPVTEAQLIGKRDAELIGPAARHIGILNDYVRVPYANGSSFASQFLFREFNKLGHQVTVIGPHDPEAMPNELPPRHLALPSAPLRNHPGVHIPFPSPSCLRRASELRLDAVVGQSTTALLDLGVWLRWTQNVPLLCVNTVHLPSVYNVLLPDSLNENARVNRLFGSRVVPWAERHIADIYNRSDGLIVLSQGLEQYWRERGVRVPIFVIPRAVDPAIFDATVDHDPFPPQAKRGQRLLVACRHTREKGVARLLDIFAKWIAPTMPDLTLTLVGDGPDHADFRARAERLGIADRTFFPGEYPLTSMPAWYRNADLFAYTSLSETYGQVVSEALWCGLPVVAFEDGKGVSQQMRHGVTGVLVAPEGSREQADWRFATEVVALLRDARRRRALSEFARVHARRRSDPAASVERYEEAIAAATEHCRDTYETRKRDNLSRVWTLSRWAFMHSTLFLTGCIRPPAVVNRHGRRQPAWRTGLGLPPSDLDALTPGDIEDSVSA